MKWRQVTIDEYIKSLETVYDVEIKGLCDDAYCPKCGIQLDDLKILDCPRCPECGTRITWRRWHRINDTDDATGLGI